ncbi:MAG: helix-turn-helix domain-containing protein [Cyclobacteriaceae bacterium]
MEVVIIVGVIQSLFLVSLLAAKTNKMPSDKVLMAWLMFAGIFLFSYYAELIGLDRQYPFIAFFAFSFGMLMGPITYIYIHVLTSQLQKFKWHYLLHGLPYVSFTLILLIKLQSNDNPLITEGIKEIEDSKTPIMWAQTITNIFNGPVYMILSWSLLNKHGINIRSKFSYVENIDLKWLKSVTLSFLILLIVVVLMNVISNYNDFIDSRTGDDIIFSTLVILVFFLGYRGVKQQVIFSTKDNHEAVAGKKGSPDKAQYLHSGLTENESKEYLESLLAIMEKEKPFLNGKLSLNDLADMLNISSNHLSQAINENLNQNFFDFINGYRVEAIKQRMLDSDSKNLTLLALAYESGFNSKSSFNNIFKKTTGLTPSQYIHSQPSYKS